jgi:hypothetical protein
VTYPTLPSDITIRFDPDGTTVFLAPDVEAALKFSHTERARGEYQFFRGQKNATWQPIASFYRISKEEKDESLKRATRFIAYTRQISKHSGMVYSDDALLAIAQHYGLPTPFLDLTTDPTVAAMFACPPETGLEKIKAAIFMYSESTIRSANELIRVVNKGIDGLSIIQLDVSNLWRLQAQQGLFLWDGIDNSTRFFAPDRIEFPHPHGGYRKDGYILYPEEKSPLENQLDLYFHGVAVQQAKEEVKLLVGNVVKLQPSTNSMLNSTPRLTTSVGVLSVEGMESEARLHKTLSNNFDSIGDCPLRCLPDTFFPSRWRFRKPELRAHTSWFGEHAAAWLRTEVRDFGIPGEVVCENLVVDLECFPEPSFHYASGSDPRLLLQCRGNRNRAGLFDVRYDRWRNSPKADWMNTSNHDTTQIEAHFSRVAAILYDGLRASPVSDDVLFRSLGHYFARARHYLDHVLGDSLGEMDFDFGKLDTEHCRVEFAVLGGHSRITKARCSSLLSCVRGDFDEWIEVLEADVELGTGFDHLAQLNFPQYIFEFERFAEMYCTEILPYEAFIGAIAESRTLGLAFNPRHVKVFGLA